MTAPPLPPITVARALELKREARAMRQEQGTKQSHALAQLAQREGFPSWERLVWAVGGAEALRSGVDGKDSLPRQERDRRQAIFNREQRKPR